MQNLVAVSRTVRAHVGGPKKFGGRWLNAYGVHLRQLQAVLNAAARLSVRKRKYDNIIVYNLRHPALATNPSTGLQDVCSRVYNCLHNTQLFCPACVSRSLSTPAADAYDQLHAVTSSSQPQKQSATALVASPSQDCTNERVCFTRLKKS